MTVLVLALLALAVPLAVIPALNGGKALTVLTGSMQPTLNPGDVAVVYPVQSFDEIELGDVVTFMPKPDDPTLVTHRAVAWATRPDGERLLITQGDANNAEDEPIREKQVRARLAYSVPWVGKVLQYGSDFGKPLLVVAVAIGLITYAVFGMVTSIRRRSAGEPPPAGDDRESGPSGVGSDLTLTEDRGATAPTGDRGATAPTEEDREPVVQAA
jgi:signal peptidase